MKQIHYKVTARHSSGSVVTRHLHAPSRTAVYKMMEAGQWQVLRIEELPQRTLPLPERRHKMKPQELGSFFKELAEMTKAGIPFVDSWCLLVRQLPQSRKKDVLMQIGDEMENGSSPSVAMETSQIFPGMACCLLRAGEHSGNLESVLSILGTYYQEENRQKQQLIQAMIYPAFLLAGTGLLLIGAVFYILPVFASMFTAMNVPLPFLTRGLLWFQAICCRYGVVLLGVSGLLVALVVYGYRRPHIRLSITSYMMRIPSYKRMYLSWCWQRFSRVMAMQLASGIPVLSAIRDAAAATPGIWFQKRMEYCSNWVQSGHSFLEAVQREDITTPFLEAMILVGENTGNYDTAFSRIAAYYDWQIARWSQRICSLLEPLTLAFMGLIIGLVVLALLLPLLDAAAAIV